MFVIKPRWGFGERCIFHRFYRWLLKFIPFRDGERSVYRTHHLSPIILNSMRGGYSERTLITRIFYNREGRRQVACLLHAKFTCDTSQCASTCETLIDTNHRNSIGDRCARRRFWVRLSLHREFRRQCFQIIILHDRHGRRYEWSTLQNIRPIPRRASISKRFRNEVIRA